MGGNKEHVSERFGRLLTLYRRPDGREWGRQELQDETGGAVTRSYVANLKAGRIENPGLAKLEAMAGAIGFPPELWFGGDAYTGRVPDEAVAAALKDETVGAILEEVVRLGARDRKLPLRMARQVSSSPEDSLGAASREGGGGA